MDICFLYFEDCPSHDRALERLQQVLAEEQVEASIEIIAIETDEQAQQWHFTGSPTILINDQDIDPPNHSQYALACRAYQRDDGRISPLPPVSKIRQAVQAAKHSPASV
jgi:hypothetical protein